MGLYDRIIRFSNYLLRKSKDTSPEFDQQVIPEQNGVNTIDVLFGDTLSTATLAGGVLKVEMMIKPPAINLLRALYEARDKGLDPELYEVVDSAYKQLKERIRESQIKSDELWGYLLGLQPIARLPPGNYLPNNYGSIRLDEQGSIYFTGIKVSLILKSK